MRALRIELRRSAAAGALLLLIVIGVLDFIYSTPGGWTSMTTVQRAGLLLSWPLAVGVGAWQARRERMAGLGELFATSPRSSAQRLGPVAAALALAVATAYLVVLLVGTAVVWRSPADLYFTLAGGAAAVVGAVSLVAAAWLGLWLGRSIPSAFTAPVVTVLAVALSTLLSELEAQYTTGPAFSMLLPVLEVPYQQDHVQLPLELSAYQGLWLAALAITAFAITTSASWRGRLLSLVPAGAAVLLLVPALPQMSASQAFVVNKQALTPVCTPDLPKVCVIKAHSGLLDEVTGPSRKALSALSVLRDSPISASEEPEERTPLFRHGAAKRDVERPVVAGVLPVRFQTDRKGHVDELDDLTAYLLAGAWSRPDCPPSDWSQEQYDRFYAAQEIAGAWLARQAGVAPLESTQQALFKPGWQALTALPARAQRERITDYRDDVLECRGADPYAQLTKGTS
jgi:hypothetical protein